MTRQRNSKDIAVGLLTFGILALGMLIPIRVCAQGSGATMTGTVSDASGALIPNAQISIKNVANGEVRTVSADAAGLYTAPNLLPGSYEVTATAPGFSTEVRSGITLTVGAQQVLNITMRVGQVSEKVEVTGEAPAVQLANSTIGGVVTQTAVVELPLNGRDWTLLATLQPGVISVAAIQSDPSFYDRGPRGYGVQMAISGSRPPYNNYRIDGISANDYANSGPASVEGSSLGVDAIREFSVLTSNYSAEYGRTSGGVINAITKSGTNSFHGDAYEFLRNSALDARNYFDPATIPEFRRNQFGGSFGGPIRKDRTFFFGDYEGIRQNLGVSTVDTVPSLDARNGIIHNPDGTTTTITVDPAVKPYLGLWGLPNGPIFPPGNTAIYRFSGAVITSENFVTARVDHRFSEQDSLFGSYQYDKASITLPDGVNDVLLGHNTGRQLISLEETHIFTPQLVNSFRVGFSRSRAGTGNNKAINPLSADPSLGVTGFDNPQLFVSGIIQSDDGLSDQLLLNYFQNSFQAYDDVFLTKGIHSLKFGFSFERIQTYRFESGVAGGRYFFGSLLDFLTNQPLALVSNLAPRGAGASSLGALAGSPRYFRQNIIGGYLQDDVRLRRNLTVNLGLRYEMDTELTEIHNKLATLVSFTGPTIHVGAPLWSNPTLRNFEPRVGFAWDPFRDGKTSVRGAFSMFDLLPLAYEVNQGQIASSPFALIGTLAPLAPGSFPFGGFNALFALGATGRLENNYIGFDSTDPTTKRSYVMQWNLDLQRELMANLTATVAYVGSRGVHQPFRADEGNDVLPTRTSAGYLWPSPIGSGTVLNPAIGQIETLLWNNNSFYDGFEAQLTKRMNHGFQVQGSYTWSRAIDENSGFQNSDPWNNSISSLYWFLPKARRGVSDFNVSQNLVMNYIWMIPTPSSFHGPAAWTARGWQLGGIVQIRSGLPFTPLIGGDPLGLNNADPFAFPDRLRGPGCQSLVNPGNVQNYVKLQCFALPKATPAIAAQCVPFQPGGPPNPIAVGTCSNLLGNAGRNDVYGPGQVNFDFSMFKNNRIKENLNLQFRAEFFNVFNHSNFKSPIDNQTLFDQTGAPVGGAGSIDKTGSANREIQFALKLIF